MQDGHRDWGFGENDFFSFQKLLHQNGLLLLFTKVIYHGTLDGR
jgi:hypothetical protein